MLRDEYLYSAFFSIPLYEYCASPFSDGLAAVKVSKRDKFGFIDKSGEMVISARFDEAMSFVEGVCAVRVGEKWGLIDKQGLYIVQPTYDGLVTSGFFKDENPFESRRSYDSEVAIVYKGEHCGVINLKTGKPIIPFKYGNIYWGERVE